MVLRYAALSGARILVGQSAAENDALCAAAEPHDLWFHLEGDSSPHVILQCAGEPCTQAIADCSASIALDGAYAKAYLRRGELRQQCGDAPRAQEDYSSAQRLDRGAVGLEAARRLHELRSGAGSSRSHAGGGAHAGAAVGTR